LDAVFLPPVRQGTELGATLERQKEELRSAIREHRPGIVLLGLGGAAKILGQELALEEGTPVFDIGAVIRGLCYSATPGQGAHLAEHHPFFHRVPLPLFYEALKEAFPDAAASFLLAKAQAQVVRDAEPRVVGDSITASRGERAGLEASDAARARFAESLAFYREAILPELRFPETETAVLAFEAWHSGLARGEKAGLRGLWRRLTSRA
jgi:hypothetical protein